MTFLAVFDSKTFHVSRDALAQRLEADWPTATLAVSSGDPTRREVRDVAWTYRNSEGEIEGRSHIDGTCIYLDGPFGLAAEFAAWYRKLVPSDVELIFCDDSYSFAVSVPEGATRAQIEENADAN